MFLIQDNMKTETFLAATSLFGIGIYAGILTRFEKWGGLSVIAWNAQEKSEVFLRRGVRLFVIDSRPRLADAVGPAGRGRALWSSISLAR